MEQEERLRVYYLGSAAILLIFSSTFLAMPVTNKISMENARMVLALVGLVFWSSLIAGNVLLFLAYGIDGKMNGREVQGKRLQFFSNLPTAIADFCFIAGAIVLAVLIGKNLTGQYVAYIDLFIIALAFHMHLLFSRGLHHRI